MARDGIQKAQSGSATFLTEKQKTAALTITARRNKALSRCDDLSQLHDTSYGHRLWLVKYSHIRAAGAVVIIGAGLVLSSPAGVVAGPLLYVGRTMGKAYCMKEKMEDLKNLQIELKSFAETIRS